MPIRNTYVKAKAHHEINKAVNKLKRGKPLRKELNQNGLKTYTMVYKNSNIRLNYLVCVANRSQYIHEISCLFCRIFYHI